MSKDGHQKQVTMVRTAQRTGSDDVNTYPLKPEQDSGMYHVLQDKRLHCKSVTTSRRVESNYYKSAPRFLINDASRQDSIR
jgi:hypothetical protein